jgi:hypothetical protein
MFYDHINDSDAEDFLCDGSKAIRDKIAEIYVKRQVTMVGNFTEDEKEEQLALIKANISLVLLGRYDQINEFATKMRLKKSIILCFHTTRSKRNRYSSFLRSSWRQIFFV